MNNQKCVIEVFKQHSPKHGIELEGMIRATGSQDVIVLANCVQMICSANNITTDMRNPFPLKTGEHDAWNAWFDPETDAEDKVALLQEVREKAKAEAEKEADAEVEALKERIAELEAENLAAVNEAIDPVEQVKNIANLAGVELQPGTPETDADPQNPNVEPSEDAADEENTGT